MLIGYLLLERIGKDLCYRGYYCLLLDILHLILLDWGIRLWYVHYVILLVHVIIVEGNIHVLTAGATLIDGVSVLVSHLY